MIVVMPILAIFYFLLYVYLKLRYGPNYVPWPAFLFVVIYAGIAYVERPFLASNIGLVFIPVILTPFLAVPVVFIIERKKRAGNLILTYKRNVSSSLVVVLGAVFILFMSYVMSFPHTRSYPGGKPIYDDDYFHEQLPISIIFGLVGLAYFSVVFRKGELFENGFATPDMQFYLWNGYSSYKWLEDANKKNDERFLLFLQGEKGSSHTIHGFSESTKNILDEVLTQKIQNQST